MNSESKLGSPAVPFYIYNAASANHIDAALLYAICMVESNCRPAAINHNDGTLEQKAAGKKVKSYGLFQLKLGTVKGLGVTTHSTVLVKQLLKPEVNAYYAAKLLRKLTDRYGSTLRAVSAYNAGHPITGNIDYVNKVSKAYLKYKVDHRF